MAKSLNELLDIINATDPESGEEFLKLLEPEKYDRVEMGSIMEATLGYDATCYYDKKDIDDYLTFILDRDDIDDDTKAFITGNRDDIVEESFNMYMEQRLIHVHGAVEAYIQEMTGIDVGDIIGDEDLDFTFEDDEPDEDPDISDSEDE